MSFTDWRLYFTLIVILVSSFIALKAFWRLLRILKIGKPNPNNPSLINKTKSLLINGFGQKKLFKEFGPGLQHFIIFWGFLIITIETLEMILEGLFSPFSFHFMGKYYDWLVYAQDILHLLILAAVVYGFYRRLVKKPKRLEMEASHSSDALLILTLTGVLMIANIFSFAGYIIADFHLGMPAFRPVSNFFAQALSFLTPSQGLILGHIGWAIHMVTVFFFLAYIPRSKHLHVVSAGPNLFFTKDTEPGSLSKINFEDESIESFGFSKVTDLSWKDILDLYSCTECGRCNDFCPTATTDKPLRPRELIVDLKEQLFAHGDKILQDPSYVPTNLVGDGAIDPEAIWACTTCRACVEACPVNIEHIDKIIESRRNLVMMEGSMPEELQTTMRNWEVQSNPWGFAQDDRDKWCAELNVPRMSDHPEAEYLFYIGCAGSFNDRNKEISTSMVKILQKAKIDFAILGKEELCNGETARRAGNEYLAQTMIQANIEVLNKYGVRKIITICPHCYNTTKNEYPEFGFEAQEVVHHTDFIARLIADGKINPQQTYLQDDNGNPEDKIKITYHDSCYLGRYNNIYGQPRDVLKALPNVELVEMDRNKENGLCCGAGGARMWMEETIGKQINVERAEEAIETSADIVASACPFCQVMMDDGVKACSDKEVKKVKPPKVLDIAELVAATL